MSEKKKTEGAKPTGTDEVRTKLRDVAAKNKGSLKGRIAQLACAQPNPAVYLKQMNTSAYYGSPIADLMHVELKEGYTELYDRHFSEIDAFRRAYERNEKNEPLNLSGNVVRTLVNLGIRRATNWVAREVKVNLYEKK
jgi:hypothetical protein